MRGLRATRRGFNDEQLAATHGDSSSNDPLETQKVSRPMRLGQHRAPQGRASPLDRATGGAHSPISTPTSSLLLLQTVLPASTRDASLAR